MCSRCRFFHVDPADKQIPQGFGRCAHLEVWRYLSQRAWGCHFAPSRFAEAAAK